MFPFWEWSPGHLWQMGNHDGESKSLIFTCFASNFFHACQYLKNYWLGSQMYMRIRENTTSKAKYCGIFWRFLSTVQKNQWRNIFFLAYAFWQNMNLLDSIPCMSFQVDYGGSVVVFLNSNTLSLYNGKFDVRLLGTSHFFSLICTTQQSAASLAPVEQQTSPPMAKTEDIPEPSSEEREKFITELKQFHLERGTPMTRPPVLSQKTLDLYRLYHLVQEYGGMEKVRLSVNSVLLMVFGYWYQLQEFFAVTIQRSNHQCVWYHLCCIVVNQFTSCLISYVSPTHDMMTLLYKLFLNF